MISSLNCQTEYDGLPVCIVPDGMGAAARHPAGRACGNDDGFIFIFHARFAGDDEEKVIVRMRMLA